MKTLSALMSFFYKSISKFLCEELVFICLARKVAKLLQNFLKKLWDIFCSQPVFHASVLSSSSTVILISKYLLISLDFKQQNRSVNSVLVRVTWLLKNEYKGGLCGKEKSTVMHLSFFKSYYFT